MLRDPSLIPLSHQHQHALALCVRLERALQIGATDLSAWQLEVHQLFADEVQFHFAAEESILFPAARDFPELTSLVEELAGDHERLREYFRCAERDAMNPTQLEAFVKLLSEHIRKEERQLFETMQKRMGRKELESLGNALHGALKDAVQICRLNTGGGKIKTP